MKIRNRKGLFLCSTILRGTQPRKAPGEGGDGIEVGPGFADAVSRMGSDDTRTPEEKDKVSVPSDADSVDDKSDGAASGDSGDGDADNSGDDGEDEGEEEKPKKRSTAQYVRDLKRELKEEKQARAAQEARIAALENGGLQNKNSNDSSSDTRPAPDPNDATKYPLGVLDDGYIEDKIEWATAKALDGRRQTEQAQAEQAKAEQHVAELRTKAETLAASGDELFDDYQEVVVEPAMRGDWPITETTFVAATEAKHGPEILYELAKDKAEAKRVFELSPLKQLKYILDKDAEIATKRTARRKPQAGEPPQNSPGGRNASNPIRPDTENLDDFRKLFYAKK